jgi:uncharacterized membrane protein
LEVSDLALDPAGQVALAVESVPAASGSGIPSGTCIPGVTCQSTPGQLSSQPSVYVCDFGQSNQGCRTASHQFSPSSGSTSMTQSVSGTAYTTAGGLQSAFAVAGPGDLVSYWVSTESAAHWEHNLGSVTSQVTALNASIAPNGQHALFASRSGTSTGMLTMYSGAGDLKWNYALVNSAQSATYATSLAWARDGGLVAIGTPGGVDVLVPSDDAPATSDDLHPYNTSPVNEVALSAAGDVVAAATNGYTYYMRVDPVSHDIVRPVFSRQTPGQAAVVAVALSQDGERFASASGTRVSFFHALHNSLIAQFDGDYDAGAPVTDLSYDGSGRLLVAAAGNSVLGFSPGRLDPVWTIDAVATGLGVPVHSVRVADAWYDGVYHPTQDATRVVVAGRTNVAAFDVGESAAATLLAPAGSAIVPGAPLSLQLTVRNAGSLTDNFSFVVQQPLSSTTSPWTVNSVPPMRLDPDQTGVANLTVTAPLGQAPGAYPIVIEVHAANANANVKPVSCGGVSSDTVACPSINLTLARTIALSVGGPDEKRLLKQGAEDDIPLAITNNGNAEGIVNLSVTQTLTRGSSWPQSFRPGNQIHVPAGATVNVDLVVTAPKDAVSGDRNVLTVYAKEGESAVASKSFTAYVDALFGSELNATNSSLQLYPGEERALVLNVHNTGNTEDVYNLSYSIAPSVANNTDWRVVLSVQQVSVPIGQIRPVAFTVKNLATQSRDATITLTATSTGDPAGAQSSFVIALSAKPAVTTPSAKGNFLPGPSPLLVVGMVALAAVARRLGGRRG